MSVADIFIHSLKLVEMNNKEQKVEPTTESGNSTKPLVVGSVNDIPDFVDEDQWWCFECQMIVEPECVTYEQTHDERCGGCGFTVW